MVTFFYMLSAMGFFSKPLDGPERAPRLSLSQRLALIEKEYRAAEILLTTAYRELAAYNAQHKDLRSAQFDGDAVVLVGAMTRDPERQRLEAARGTAQKKRDDLLATRAELLQQIQRMNFK